MHLPEKITGYLLLAVGLLLLVYSVFSVFQVLTGRSQPLPDIRLQPIGVDMSALIPSDLPPNLQPAQTKAEIITAADLSLIMNLTLHYLLMSFIAGVGFKISSLGVQLLRPVEVKFSPKETQASH